MREPIFYSSDSAYDFQYRDLASRKYANDIDWFERAKGFSPADAKKIIGAVGVIQNELLQSTREAIMHLPPEQWTMLPAFRLTCPDLGSRTGLSLAIIERFFKAFSIKPSAGGKK